MFIRVYSARVVDNYYYCVIHNFSIVMVVSLYVSVPVSYVLLSPVVVVVPFGDMLVDGWSHNDVSLLHDNARYCYERLGGCLNSSGCLNVHGLGRPPRGRPSREEVLGICSFLFEFEM